ncbi:hypothetical protein [Alicyclobacillus sendaiensis]|uniref:hypothetical protein n=1 Tax=Alicyclobacillus sendaiensis TaxID=192387 RepID=UPI00272B1C4A|nr:hypothetical protein [Alicyclobacillus sendaiensis]
MQASSGVDSTVKVVHVEPVTTKFPADAYSPTAGFLCPTPGVQVPGGPKAGSYAYGRIWATNLRAYLPQPGAEGYRETYDEQASGDWIAWQYVTMDMSDGETRIDAYDVKAKRAFEVWRASAENSVLLKMQLVGSELWYLTQKEQGTGEAATVVTALHRRTLLTGADRIVLSRAAQGNEEVITDFAVDGSTVAVVEERAQDVLHVPMKIPFTLELDDLAHHRAVTVAHGENENPSTLCAANGIYAWSSNAAGVMAYVSATGQTLHIASTPSYVAVGGNEVWWRAINSDAYGGENVRSGERLRFPSSVKPVGIVFSNGVGIVNTMHNTYTFSPHV